jgi:hypothetical protein
VDRRRIDLRDPIKETGEHTVVLKLHREVVAKLKVRVVAVDAPPTEADEEPEAPAEDERRRRRDEDDETDED